MNDLINAIDQVIEENDLPHEWSKGIATEIKELKHKKESNNRIDLRSQPFVTIDGKDAKDFDDALSFTPLENGKTEIGIHIADVSHYVQPDSILDEEAYDRATSVYLVDRVIPMLPEVLSNGACSLRPHEEKYTFSAVFTVNEKMEIEKEWFGKTIILSNHRFSYEEVQYILDNKNPSVGKETSITGEEYKISKSILDALQQLDIFAKILRNRRMSKGCLLYTSPSPRDS